MNSRLRNEQLRWGLSGLALLGLAMLSASGCAPAQSGNDNTTANANDNVDDNANENMDDLSGERVITPVAGDGVGGLGDDGFPALESPLYLPQDVTVNPTNGQIYIVDWNNHRIRRINESGNIETVAGTGELGDGADGYAADVQFNHPTSVTFDDAGNMYVAAWHNSKVKKVDTNGNATNIAGTGGRSYGGDGGDPNLAILDLPSSTAFDSAGNLYISDQANYRIRKVDFAANTINTVCGTGVAGYEGDGGPADVALLNAPKGQAAQPAARIAIDNLDRIIIADTSNHVIRMIDEGVITTIAGTGETGWTGDGGPALLATFTYPADVAVTNDGQIYVADTLNNAIRLLTPNGDGTYNIDTIAGQGPDAQGYDGDGGRAREALLNRPYGIGLSADETTLYIADTHNHRVRRITIGIPDDYDPEAGGEDPFADIEIVECTGEVGSICTFAGTGHTGSNGDGLDRLRTVLYWPFDIEFTDDDRLIVLDWNNHRVREILSDDTFLTVMGTDGLGDGPVDLADLTAEGAVGTTVNLNHPTNVIDLPNGLIGIVAWHNHKIRTLDTDGRVRVVAGSTPGFDPLNENGPVSAAKFNQPSRSVLDANGNLFLIDQRNQRIRVIRNFETDLGDGIVYTVAGTGTKGFNGDDGDADMGGTGLATTVQLAFPAGGNPEPASGIDIDDNGVIYFSDTHNHRIRKIEFADADFLQGTVTTVAGTGEAADQGSYSGDGGPAVDAQLNFPQDLEIGPDGNLYFCDTNNNVIRMVNLTTGVIERVAGTGQSGYDSAEETGPATDAQLNRPFGIEFGPDGDLYISDTFNSRVRKVEMP